MGAGSHPEACRRVDALIEQVCSLQIRHLYVRGAVGGKSRESTFLSRAGTRQTQGEPNYVTVLRPVELKTHSPGPLSPYGKGLGCSWAGSC